ncbi:MAG: hypothetical protein EXS39_06375 [Opitutaceae bacterium]|nr:hypothetical protein [Opitutaceae bacterium]
MNFLTRLAGYSVLLLLIFLAAAVAAQNWLHKQTLQIRAEAITAKRAQLAAVLPAVAPPGREWSEGYDRSLSAMIGGAVNIYGEALPEPPQEATIFFFDEPLPGSPAMTARVIFTAPPVTRLVALHQRVVVGLALLAFGNERVPKTGPGGMLVRSVG